MCLLLIKSEHYKQKQQQQNHSLNAHIWYYQGFHKCYCIGFD